MCPKFSNKVRKVRWKRVSSHRDVSPWDAKLPALQCNAYPISDKMLRWPGYSAGIFWGIALRLCAWPFVTCSEVTFGVDYWIGLGPAGEVLLSSFRCWYELHGMDISICIAYVLIAKSIVCYGKFSVKDKNNLACRTLPIAWHNKPLDLKLFIVARYHKT